MARRYSPKTFKTMQLKLVFFVFIILAGCGEKNQSRPEKIKLILLDEEKNDLELRKSEKGIVPQFSYRQKGFGHPSVYVSFIHYYHDDIKRIDASSIRDYQLIDPDTIDFNTTWFYWDNEPPLYLTLKKDYDDLISNEKINGLTIFEISIYANSIE